MFDGESALMRINKFLSAIGYCSRREADRLISEGKVLVDGEQAELGTVVKVGMNVTVNGTGIGGVEQLISRKPVLLAVNKPVGVVCTTSTNDRAPNIVELVGYPERVYPVGRLDKDSEGLILLTNMGELADEILRGANGHEKEYLVRVDQPITEGFVKQMRSGVHLDQLQVTTRPCRLSVDDKLTFHITLTQGLNRQIRRMCEALGYHVVSLKRIRIMNIRLGGLKSGTWRNVTAEEMKALQGALEKRRGSKNAGGRTGSRSEERYRERQKSYFRRRRSEA